MFTPPTRTRQNCLVLSAVVFTPPTRQVDNSAVWTQLQTRQKCLVLSSWRCEHNCRQDKTVLSRLQLCSHRRRGPDKTVLSLFELCGSIRLLIISAVKICQECLQTASASGNFVPKPITGALPLGPTGGLSFPRTHENCWSQSINQNLFFKQ